jgi:hypothetical protein
MAFFYFHLFFRIGTYQRVTGEKNEKFPSPFDSGLGCGWSLVKQLQLLPRPLAAKRIDSDRKN